MKLIFNIKYHTTWGQRLFIVGSCAELGSNNRENAKEMHYSHNGIWTLETNISSKIRSISYNYIFEDENGNRHSENKFLKHSLNISTIQNNSAILLDYWLTEPKNKMFYSSAFTKNIFARESTKPINSKGNLIIRVAAPTVLPGQTLAITGNQYPLGYWKTTGAQLLSDENFPQWEIRLNADEITFPFEYKFIVIDSKTKKLCYWEEGENRVIERLDEFKTDYFIISDFPVRAPKLNWKADGTVIPIFSLRSDNDFGIGDIFDLIPLIDWAKRTGKHFIQTLPINDTTRTHTWRDSYPYSAISIFALHPLYINIAKLGLLNDKKRMSEYNRIQKKLNKKADVDYEAVEKYKTQYYRDYFKQEKKNILNDKAFKTFVEDNKEWLIPYTAFSCLRDKFKTADYTEWGDYAQYDFAKIKPLFDAKSKMKDETDFIFFLQYILHKQFSKVAEYARQNRVVLKGDIPIGVNRHSVETWTEPEYFNMNMQAGAPPDDFSEDGQNWSFPTYNWEVMERDDFRWWKKRFRKMSDYFDCFRIDHILGFFRIWEIPVEYESGLFGHFCPALPLSKEEIKSYGLDFVEELFLEDPYRKGFYHPRISAHKSDAYNMLPLGNKNAFDRLHYDFFYVRHNEFWKTTALKRLTPLVHCTNMLVCGEDLGMIPQSVHEVMEELQIFTLELERAPKEYGAEFTDLEHIPYKSVCTTSTHDMSPIRLWWEEDRHRTQRYYNMVLHHEGNAPKKCTPEIAREILDRHLHSTAMLTIIPLQDLLAASNKKRPDAKSERINVPANPKNYWKYRMDINVDDL